MTFLLGDYKYEVVRILPPASGFKALSLGLARHVRATQVAEVRI